MQVTPNASDPLGMNCVPYGGGSCNRVPAEAPTDWRYSPPAGSGYALCRTGTLYSIRTASGSMSCDYLGGYGFCYEPTDAVGTLVCFAAVTSPPLSLAPTSLNFGQQTVGSTSDQQSIRLTNNTLSPIPITSISSTGDFQVARNMCPPTLSRGAMCDVYVQFVPMAVGTRTGILSVVSGTTFLQASLTGIGMLGTPALTLTPTNLSFAALYFGTTSPAQNVTVKNTGGDVVSISSITTTVTDFAISANNCPASLGVAATCMVSLTFTPGAIGARNGLLKVASNAPGSPHSVGLSGSGQGNIGNWGPFDDKNAGFPSDPAMGWLGGGADDILNGALTVR